MDDLDIFVEELQKVSFVRYHEGVGFRMFVPRSTSGFCHYISVKDATNVKNLLVEFLMVLKRKSAINWADHQKEIVADSNDILNRRAREHEPFLKEIRRLVEEAKKTRPKKRTRYEIRVEQTLRRLRESHSANVNSGLSSAQSFELIREAIDILKTEEVIQG